MNSVLELGLLLPNDPHIGMAAAHRQVQMALVGGMAFGGMVALDEMTAPLLTFVSALIRIDGGQERC